MKYALVVFCSFVHQLFKVTFYNLKIIFDCKRIFVSVGLLCPFFSCIMKMKTLQLSLPAHFGYYYTTLLLISFLLYIYC